MKYNVVHKKEDNIFEVDINGISNILRYEMEGKRMVFFTTFVDESLEGNGIASKLTKTALEYAIANGFTIVPMCSFTQAYIKRHKEYQKHVEC